MDKAITEIVLKRVLDNLDDFDEEENRELFFSLLSDHAEDSVWFAPHYSEPGYDQQDPKLPILFSNWNGDVMSLFGKFALEVGCEIEWSDEWLHCGECEGAFRKSPDSYGWTMYGVWEPTFSATCGDCIKADPSDYLEAIRNKEDHAVTFDLDLTEHGYVKVGDFEYGVQGGQKSSPSAIAELMRNSEVSDFLFSVSSQGQFSMKFSLYVAEAFGGVALEAVSTGNTDYDVDPARELERGLKEVAKYAKSLG